MDDEQIRKFCLEQAVLIIQRIPGRYGCRCVAPMELASLLFEYVKNGKVNDPEDLAF